MLLVNISTIVHNFLIKVFFGKKENGFFLENWENLMILM